MLIATLATLVIGQSAAISCPVMGSAIHGKGSGSIDFNGARYTMCCGGCDAGFKATPDKFLKQSAEKKLTVGVFMYDPTTGVKLEAKNAKGTSDFGGLRYYFATADAKKAFDAEPKKYTVQPKKEALWCAVMNHALASYKEAGAYVDHGDTRYYICCAGCLGKMKEKTAEYAAKIADKVVDSKAVAVKG
ncbi:MAG: YHS domain-containing protein [Chlorobia bacterium]|nr:YHS domain-containing protein [Fimbriimonadaceae bacterium]